MRALLMFALVAIWGARRLALFEAQQGYPLRRGVWVIQCVALPVLAAFVVVFL